jgi:hypothetical protein
MLASLLLAAAAVTLPHGWTIHSASEGAPGTGKVQDPNYCVGPLGLVRFFSQGSADRGRWVWTEVGCWEQFGCAINVTADDDAHLMALIQYNLSGTGRGAVQLNFDDDRGESWEVDINILASPNFPICGPWPRYYCVVPLGTYAAAGFPDYYAVLNGEAWGYGGKQGEFVLLDIPIRQVLLAVNQENPTLFPVPIGGWGKLRLSAYGVATEALDDGVSPAVVASMIVTKNAYAECYSPPRQVRQHLEAIRP